MAVNLQQRLESLRAKAQLLTQRYELAQQQLEQTRQQLEEKSRALTKAEAENARLRQRVEELQVVTTLNPRREDVERSRAFLAELVRDIDKCINELTQ